MTDNTVCPHSRPKRCSLCDRCVRCHYDECDGEHSTARGRDGDAVRERRKQARMQSEQPNDVARTYELRQNRIGDLNEENLFEDLDDAIAAETEAVTSEGPFSRLANALGIDHSDFSSRTLERKSLFDLESLRAVGTLSGVCVGIETVFTQIIRKITSCGESFTVVFNSIRDRLSMQRVDDSLYFFAESFIRATGEMEERMLFAILVHSTSDRKILRDALIDAQTKALVDRDFMGVARPRFYFTRAKTAANVDDDDEEVLQDAESSYATVQVALSVEEQLAKKTRWIFSKQKLVRAEADWERLRLGQKLEPKWNKPRVSLDSIMNALKFLETLSVGWKGGATQSAAISDDCKLANVPVLNVAMTAQAAWDAYLATAKKTEKERIFDAPRLGRDSFYLLYNGICRVIKDKHALSYYFTGMLTALDELELYINRIDELWQEHHSADADKVFSEEFDELGFTPESLLLALDCAREHAKYTLRTHIRLDDCDGLAIHCAVHATGGECNTPHDKTNVCKECQNFAYLADSVRRLMNAVANSLGREHKDAGIYARDAKKGPVQEILTMGPAITFCSEGLNLYHRHVVRGVVMNRAIARVMDDLPVGTLLIIVDHKQKIQPISFNESSEEYYGKKGISLLGFLVRWREDEGGDLNTRYVDVVSNNGTQNAHQVQALLNAVLPSIKDLVPSATQLILVSDNGPAFSGQDNFRFCFHRNKLQWDCGLTLARWLYFEAQCGKTTLDTHFSFVNIVLQRFARESRPVKNYRDVFDALKANGGITNSIAMLAEFNQTSDGDDEEYGENGQKIDQIRKIHDVQFEDERILTFHYAGISFGVQEHTFKVEVTRYESPVSIVEKAASAKVIDGKKKANNAASVSSAIALTAGSSARPHHVLIGEALVDFATRPNQSAVPLLPAPNPLEETEAMAPSTSSKKKKKSSSAVAALVDESGMPRFGSNWASAAIRPKMGMSPNLVEKVRSLVSVFIHPRTMSLTYIAP